MDTTREKLEKPFHGTARQHVRPTVTRIAGISAITLLNTAFVCLPALAQETGNADRKSADSSGVVESQAIVFEDPHTDPYDRANSFGFNHAPSVTALGGERLMCVWFSGPFEGSVHQAILGSMSDDGGKTWSAAKVINDTPHVSDFDPAFLNAGDRVFLFFSNGRWERLPSLGPSKQGVAQVGVDSFHLLVKSSNDRGTTWSEPREVNAGPGWNSRSNGICLRNGELLLPTHHLEPPHKSSVLISSDNGVTWTRGPDIVTPDAIGAGEPSVAELPSGDLVMALRTTDGKLWMARSQDHGRRWAAPERQDLSATSSSINLFCTSTGKLLLTHNPTKPPLRTQLTMRESDDEGRTWKTPILVAQIEPPTAGDVEWSRQVCYPSVCELPDGTLLLAWARITLSADNQSGVICCARVRWK